MRKAHLPTVLSAAILAGVFLSACLLIRNKGLILDEAKYYEKFASFMRGDFRNAGDYTVFPGHLYFLYAAGNLFHVTDVSGLRLVSSVVCFSAVLSFLFLARKVSPGSSLTKLLQFSFLPIVFPFYFLLYTDVLSLSLVLAALLLALSGRTGPAALTALAGCFVRQNNIVWMAFLFLLACRPEHVLPDGPKRLLAHARRNWVFVAAAAVFAAFVIANGGFTYGDRWAHPLGRPYFGNLYLLLFFFFALFLPHNLYQLPRIVRRVRSARTAVPLVALAFVVYHLTFTSDHPYNATATRYLIGNFLLDVLDSNFWLKSLFFLPVAYSVLSLTVTRLSERSFYLLYPFTFLYLAPSWLIEPRYYFIPFAFFILFKREEDRRVEYAAISLNAVLAAVLFGGVLSGRLFL